jgi:hypothetical protein
MEVLKRLTMLVLLAKQSIFVLCTQAAQIMFTHQNHQMRTLHAIQQILETKRKMRRRKRLLLGLRKDRKKRNTWVANGRTDQWWNNMLGDDISDQCWKKNFRMTKEAFLKLADEIRDLVSPSTNTPNYRFLTTEKKLAITLYYLKDKGSLWMTANTFGVHECTVSKTVPIVCDAINKRLGPKLLRLPSTEEEMKIKCAQFEMKYGMYQAFGCVDGTHIRINAPSQSPADYVNYKLFHSLNV